MTIDQLKSGSYRIRQMYNGKRYQVVIDHKPTSKEALQLMAGAMEGCECKDSFRSAALGYIDMKRGVLSPRTIREYSLYPDRLPGWFVRMPVSKIGADEVQSCISELSLKHSPKTVRVLHGFISAVMGRVKPNLTLKTTLPKLQKKEPYIPLKEDFLRLLEAARGTQYHIPIQLAFYGLRRGEICALEITDLDERNVIHVTKDLVQTSSGEWVKKPPKTPSSVREVPIDASLADEIRAQGYIYNGFPGAIANFFARTQKELGMERFSPHKLRHLFASVLLDKGYDMKTIQDLGGWQGNETVTKVYLHSLKLKDEATLKKIVDDMKDFLE